MFQGTIKINSKRLATQLTPKSPEDNPDLQLIVNVRGQQPLPVLTINTFDVSRVANRTQDRSRLVANRVQDRPRAQRVHGADGLAGGSKGSEHVVHVGHTRGVPSADRQLEGLELRAGCSRCRVRRTQRPTQ